MELDPLFQIEWSKKAIEQLKELHAFIAEDNAGAADRQLELVIRSIEQLALYPAKGRVGRIAGSRELVISGTPYIAAYELLGDAIYILAILHGAQRWPAESPGS